MTTFKPTSQLKSLQAPTTKSISFATATKSNPTESLPSEQKWWTNKFHLGPSSMIPKKKSTSSTSVTFQTKSSGSAIVSQIAFAPNTIKGFPYQMAVVSGPRVGLYGGTQSSSLARALARTNKKGSAGGSGGKNDQINLFGEDETKVQPDRTISTGGQPAHCASYHHDGRLIAIGCDHGFIKICDTLSRATIRTFSTHGTRGGYKIRSTGWLPEGKDKQRMVWSAGDDAVVRIWDLSGDAVGVGDGMKPLISLDGHGDAIRSTSLFTHDEKPYLVSGSYDHTIRVWALDELKSNVNQDIDERDRCMAVMNHGAPVEVLLTIQPKKQEAPIVISAGGTEIKLWNPLVGECLTTVQTKHSKTITSLCLATILRENQDDNMEGGEGEMKNISKRLISAGLDGLIRIYSADCLFDMHPETNVNKYHLQYLHGVKTSAQITSLAISPDNTRLVIGSTEGYVTVRQRAKFVAQGVKRKRSEEPKAGTYSYFMRGANAAADADDHVVIMQGKKKLQKYDIFLQKFRYSDALDAVLESRDPRAVSARTSYIVDYSFYNIVNSESDLFFIQQQIDQIVAVLEELGKRRGLITALSNRDEETLEPLLSFTTNFIHNPKYTPLLVGVANQLCDIYSNVFGQSDLVDEYFEKLQLKVRAECKVQSSLLQLIGQIDAVMYTAEIASSNEDN